MFVRSLFGTVSILAALGALNLASPAYAAQCVGSVTYIDIEYGGLVAADIGFGLWRVCNLDQNYSVTTGPYGTYNVTPQSCQALLASFMTAKAQGSVVKAYIIGSCPASLAPSPDYPYAWLFY